MEADAAGAGAAASAQCADAADEGAGLRARAIDTRTMKKTRVADMDCLPDSLKGRSYYHPTQEGREKLLAQRMEEIRRIRAGKRGGGGSDQ